MTIPVHIGSLARRTGLCVLLGIVSCPLALPAARAQAAQATVEQVKAAYLHKFPDYVQWPAGAFAGPDSPMVVAVAGADDVYVELQGLAQSHPPGRRMKVLHLSRPDPGTPVHLLYIGKDFARELPAWIAAYRDRPVVTVADAPRGLEAGAVMNFVEVGDRVRFEASPAAAGRTGVRLSSRLLGVAERIVKEQP